jgi:uncharacterized membrane protein
MDYDSWIKTAISIAAICYVLGWFCKRYDEGTPTEKNETTAFIGGLSIIIGTGAFLALVLLLVWR